MNFGPFLAPPSPLTFHNVKNHGGGGAHAEGEPGGIAKNQEQKKTTHQRKTKTNRNKTTKKDTGGRTNNTVRVFENVASQRPATFSQKTRLMPV